MSTIIDVAVIVDGQYVVKTYGLNNNSESPPGYYHENIYVTVKNNEVVQSNASGWLQMRAKSESESGVDFIRWRMQEISLDADSQCRIVQFNFQQGANLLTPPRQRTLKAGIDGSRSDRFWESKVLASGTVQYNIQFMVLDTRGRVQGYYTYDPLIYIS